MDESLMKLTESVLGRGYLASLGVVDQAGPWVADVIYIFDEEFNLYWMSTPHRRHSRAIDSGSNRVAAAIAVTQGLDRPDEGLQISGTALRLEHPSTDLLQQWMIKKGKRYTSDMEDVLDEHVWYKFVPDLLSSFIKKSLDTIVKRLDDVVLFSYMKELSLKSVVWKEGTHYVSQCLNVDVSSFGKTRKEAIANLDEALALYFEDTMQTKIQRIERAEIVPIQVRYA